MLNNKEEKQSLTKKLFDVKEINRSIFRQYWAIIAIWMVVVFLMITLFTIYAVEMASIFNHDVTYGGITYTVNEWREHMHELPGLEQQQVYKAMFDKIFNGSMPQARLIWFSNMLFIKNFTAITDYQQAWDSKLLQVTTGEIYALISTVVAIAGLGIYLWLITQYGLKMKKFEKNGFTNKYPLYTNDLQIYSVKTYVNFFIAVSIFFSFYILSATIVMLVYMLIVKAIYKKIEKVNANKNISANVFNASDLSYFKMLFILMAVMICYNLLTSFVTLWLNIDINSVLSPLFGAGGIAVVIITLVRNLLQSSITEIRKKMKNIDKQINEIKFFYRVRQGEAALDFEYAKILPPVIKELINKSTLVSTTVLKENFDKLFEYTDFVQNFKFAKKRDAKRRNFILYRMYNEITTFEEIEDIKINLNKELELAK